MSISLGVDKLNLHAAELPGSSCDVQPRHCYLTNKSDMHISILAWDEPSIWGMMS